MIWLALLLACGAGKRGEPVPEVDPEPSAEPAEEPSAVGAWTSPSCGERTYERLLTLSEGGVWTAEDRVSPCPPGAQCVWSGVVITSGTWTEDGDGIALTQTSPANEQARPRPTRVAPRGAEILSTEEDGACAYSRAKE